MNTKFFRSLAALTLCLSFSIFATAQKRSNSVPAVNLNVAIDDSITSTGIHSDGNPYFNGQDSVTAQFSPYGYFTLNSGGRVISAFYPQPSPLSSDSGQGVGIMTFADGTYLQNMTVGQSVCKGMAVNFYYNDVNKTIRTIGYHAGHGDLNPTGYVRISHPDPNTWIISNVDGSCVNNDIARVRDSQTKGKRAPDVDYGLFAMPLRMILTRQ